MVFVLSSIEMDQNSLYRHLFIIYSVIPLCIKYSGTFTRNTRVHHPHIGSCNNVRQLYMNGMFIVAGDKHHIT